MRIQVSREQVLHAFETVREDPGFHESAEIVKQGGLPVEMLQAMSLRPELLRAFAAFSDCVYPGGLLERPLKEWVILEISRKNACQFCTTSHVAIIKGLGLSFEPVLLLEADNFPTDRIRAAVEYARAAHANSNRIPEERYIALRQLFTEPEIVELTFVVGFIHMLNLFNNCLGVTYRGDYERTQNP